MIAISYKSGVVFIVKEHPWMVVVYILTDSVHVVRKLDGNFGRWTDGLSNECFWLINIVSDFADLANVKEVFLYFISLWQVSSSQGIAPWSVLEERETCQGRRMVWMWFQGQVKLLLEFRGTGHS